MAMASRTWRGWAVGSEASIAFRERDCPAPTLAAQFNQAALHPSELFRESSPPRGCVVLRIPARPALIQVTSRPHPHQFNAHGPSRNRGRQDTSTANRMAGPLRGCYSGDVASRRPDDAVTG